MTDVHHICRETGPRQSFSALNVEDKYRARAYDDRSFRTM